MPKQTWIIATILSVAVVLGFMGLSVVQKAQELDKLRAELRAARDSAATKHNEAAKLQEEIESSKAQIAELEREKQAAEQKQSTLEQEMRAALESKDITISQLQGKLTVNILDRILFDSGEAVLRSEGEKILQQIAQILSQHPNRQINVIGHTDNVPIRASARSRYASNWELSTARATAAVRFLQERAGVDPRRLGALGYGEFHPIEDNSTADGRAKNRRIALVVLPEELAASDVRQVEKIPKTAPAPVDGPIPAAPLLDTKIGR